MAITFTSGYVPHTDAGWVITGVNTYYPIAGAVMPQPKGFKDTKEIGYKYIWRSYLEHDGGTGGFTVQSGLNVDENSVVGYDTESSGTSTSAWRPANNTELYNNGNQVNNATFDGYDFRVWSGEVKVKYEGTATPGSTPIVLAFNSNESPDNSSSDSFEITGNHAATPATYEWTPYDENESCSAFICKRVGSENVNTIHGKSWRSRTIPLFGYRYP